MPAPTRSANPIKTDEQPRGDAMVEVEWGVEGWVGSGGGGWEGVERWRESGNGWTLGRSPAAGRGGHRAD